MATVTLTDAVDAVGGVPAVALEAGSTVTLTDAVDAIGGVPAVTVAPRNATVSLTNAVDAAGGAPAPALEAGATITLTDAVDAIGAVPAVALLGGSTVTVTAVAAVVAAPAVALSSSSTITLTDAVDAVAAVPTLVVGTGFLPDTIDAPMVVGPLMDSGVPYLDVATIDASSQPSGPVWISNDSDNPFVPTVTVRMFEVDGTTEVPNVLDNAFGVNWFDEINGPGYGTLSLPLSDTSAVAALTLGRLIRCYVGGVAAFTWQIEVSPERREVQRGEEFAQVVRVRGRGAASVLDDAIVYPAIPVLESAPDLDSPFRGLDRIFSFASPDFPNDNWGNAIKQYEYSELQSYRYQAVEVEDDVYENFPAPVDMPYPNSAIYDGLSFPLEQKAYWIWPNADAFQEGWAFYRGILVNPATPRQITISTTADNLFTLFVDGVPILGEDEDVRMWDGWKDITVTLDETRYYMFGCAVQNVPGGSVNPGGWLLASYYPDADGQPEDWALTSNHLWTAHFSPTTWPGWTAGQIVGQLVTEARNRGSLTSSFSTAFTPFNDSDGWPWNVTVNSVSTPYIPWFQVRLGSTALDALNQLHDEGWIDWRLAGGGFWLEVWSADTPSQYSGATYAAGTNIVELDREFDRPLANALLAVWQGGMVEVEDAASIAANGRREDVFNTNARSEEEAIRDATVELNFRSLTGEGGAISMTIEPTGTSDTPYLSYYPGDDVYIPSLQGGQALVRVLSIAVEQDDLGEPIFTLELNRKLPVRERGLNRILRDIGGKSALTTSRKGTT